MKNRIVIKSSKAGMTVILDPECAFEELIAELATKFKESAGSGECPDGAAFTGRTLTAAQEMQIVNTITENSGIEVLCLLDQDLERVERCEKALNQKLMEFSERTGQFYRGGSARGEIHRIRGQHLSSLETCVTVPVWRPKEISLCWGNCAALFTRASPGNREAVVAAHGNGASSNPDCRYFLSLW